MRCHASGESLTEYGCPRKNVRIEHPSATPMQEAWSWHPISFLQGALVDFLAALSITSFPMAVQRPSGNPRSRMVDKQLERWSPLIKRDGRWSSRMPLARHPPRGFSRWVGPTLDVGEAPHSPTRRRQCRCMFPLARRRFADWAAAGQLLARQSGRKTSVTFWAVAYAHKLRPHIHLRPTSSVAVVRRHRSGWRGYRNRLGVAPRQPKNPHAVCRVRAHVPLLTSQSRAFSPSEKGKQNKIVKKIRLRVMQRTASPPLPTSFLHFPPKTVTSSASSCVSRPRVCQSTAALAVRFALVIKTPNCRELSSCNGSVVAGGRWQGVGVHSPAATMALWREPCIGTPSPMAG